MDGKEKDLHPFAEVDRLTPALPFARSFCGARDRPRTGQTGGGVSDRFRTFRSRTDAVGHRGDTELVIVERLFKLCRLKLLKIPLFAWGYGHWRQGIHWITSMRAWQAARRMFLLARLNLGNMFRQFRKSTSDGRF